VIDEQSNDDIGSGKIVSQMEALAAAGRDSPAGRAAYIEASRALRAYINLCLRADALKRKPEPPPTAPQRRPASLRLTEVYERLMHGDRTENRHGDLANYHEALADVRYQATATCARAREVLARVRSTRSSRGST
jgi:hypothetical protein